MRHTLIGLTIALFFVALADAVNSLPERIPSQSIDKIQVVSKD